MNIFLIAILLTTLVLLLIPFLFFYKNMDKQRKGLVSLSILGYIVCAAPMLYFSIDHMVNNYVDANIGLGLGFFVTWALTACVYLGWLILVIKSKRRVNL
ncbi:hypothetical protein [Bacillus weihaiensis]|uniref:hypothetical protein n=1 Tax=Bacillus weihaiensis TaxID=1547283 RepID=UPI002353F46A|nr:hypothetical protein [Bacillus weihaiensis]